MASGHAKITLDRDHLLIGALGLAEAIRVVIGISQGIGGPGEIGSVGGGALGSKIAHFRKQAIEDRLGLVKLILAAQYLAVTNCIFDGVRSVLICLLIVRQSVERAKLQRVDLRAIEVILRRTIDIELITHEQLIVDLLL